MPVAVAEVFQKWMLSTPVRNPEMLPII